MAGIYASRWANHPTNSDNSGTPALAPDPTMPRLQAIGSEVQRYETPRAGIDEMEDYLFSMNVVRMNDTLHMQRLMGKNAKDIEDLRKVFQNDIAILERKIQMMDMGNLHETSPEAHYTTTVDKCPPDEDMLSVYSTGTLAEAYTNEANERYETAVELRRHAVALKGGHYDTAQKQVLDALPAQKRILDKAPTRKQILDHVPAQKKVHDDVPARKKADDVPPPSHCEPKWAPAIVRQMAPIDFAIPDHKESFTFDFIHDNLGGSLWSSGFYFESGHSILPSKAYWILESDHEPFIPQSPGQHGAKLTAFFNETLNADGPTEDNYMDVPVFIKDANKNEYRYYGNYSQNRYSDKVGYDTLVDHIPERTLRQWADRLSETGRPQWVTQALTKHFWPAPEYQGPFPTDSAINTPATVATGGNSARGGTERHVTKALQDYAQQLKDWQKESAIHASLLTSDAIFKAFKNADSDIEPGLRLWWEYLECVKYDAGFYNMLVKIKHNPRLARRPEPRAAPKQENEHSHSTDRDSYEFVQVPDIGGHTVNGDDIETLDLPLLGDEPVVLDPIHPPSPNPKKLQKEQWGNFDTASAEAEAKKLTMFKRINFNDDCKQQLKITNDHLKKANAASKKPTSSSVTTKDKSHCKMVKPWETKNKETGEALTNAWQGGGDMKVAKELNEGFQDGRWKKGELSSGNGVQKKALLPHLRAK